jgi:DNA-binding NtrC family response regulator
MARILIIEDEENLRFSIGQALTKGGHEIHEAGAVGPARALLDQHAFDLVLTDINLSGGSGIDVIRRLKEEEFDGAVVVMTAFGTVESAVEAMKLGAEDYLQKPVRLDEVVLLVQRILENREAMRRLKLYDRLAESDENTVLGKSDAWRRTLALADRLAQMPIPDTGGASMPTILILGETGTGKGVLARHIHDAAPDTTDASPFVHVNCSALPPSLVESELFGHEKGAFTDAKSAREGLFEMAEGGTIFLDEIGDMPIELQAKILTLVEEGVFRRVGGTKDRRVRARLIAATNQDLDAQVQEGVFRRDLLYRLNAFTISIPPLRERDEDALLLAEQMIQRFAKQFRRPAPSLSDEAKDAILAHDWQGNVRELINAAQRGAMLGEGPLLFPEDLGLRRAVRERAVPVEQNGHQDVAELAFDFESGVHKAEDVERELMIQALERTGGNVSKAAKLIGMQRSSFRYRVERFGLEERVKELSGR